MRRDYGETLPPIQSYGYDELLDISQAAARADVTEDEIRHRMRTGRLPRLRLMRDRFTKWDVDRSGPGVVLFADYFDRIVVDGWGNGWGRNAGDDPTQYSVDGKQGLWRSNVPVPAWAPGEQNVYGIPGNGSPVGGSSEYRYTWSWSDDPGAGESWGIALELQAQLGFEDVRIRASVRGGITADSWVMVWDWAGAEVYSAAVPIDPPLDLPAGSMSVLVAVDVDAGTVKMKLWNASAAPPADWNVELSGIDLSSSPIEYTGFRLDRSEGCMVADAVLGISDYVLRQLNGAASPFEDTFERDVVSGWGNDWEPVLGSPVDEAHVSGGKGVWALPGGAEDRWDCQRPVGIVGAHRMYAVFDIPKRPSGNANQFHIGVGDVEVAPAVQYGVFLFPSTNTMQARCWVDDPDGQYELGRSASLPMPADASALFMRGMYEGGVFRLRIWTDAEREPSVWHIEEQERMSLGGPFSAGGPVRVIFVAGPNHGVTEMSLDKVSISNIEPEAR